MRRAIFRAMTLTLFRDRAALALAFALPAVIYSIFALVFSSAAGGDMTIRLALLTTGDDIGLELASGLKSSSRIAEIVPASDPHELREAVRSGRADVGIEIESLSDQSAPTIRFVTDATRGGAALIAESVLAGLAPRAEEETPTVERHLVNPVNNAAPMAAYFAAGVAMLFLLLSGFQSALSLHEECDAGVLDRVSVGPAGVGAAIDGKFLFIIVQGLAQTAVILIVAAVGFGVNLAQAPGALLLAAFAASVAASGLTLAVTTLCRSRAQAHAVGTVFSLISAAIGGSMAPKFLMPSEMRSIGGWSPNALGIDAFAASLWTGGGVAAAAAPIFGLLCLGAGGLVIARLAAPLTLRSTR
jgi:ABC-2 type transport system permease protein